MINTNLIEWLYGYKCGHVQVSEKMKAKLDYASYSRILAEKEYKFLDTFEWHKELNDNNFPFELLQLTEAQKQEMLKWLSINEDEDYYRYCLWMLSHIFNDFDKNGLSYVPIAQTINQNYQWLKSVYASKYPQSYAQFETELTEALSKPQPIEETIDFKTKMEDARISGSTCPYCNSTNVRSYNRDEWKCYNCKKRFRKR